MAWVKARHAFAPVGIRAFGHLGQESAVKTDKQGAQKQGAQKQGMAQLD